MTQSCAFCEIDKNRILYQDNLCFTIRDGYPVSTGHTLIIPKRHIPSFFETTNEEKTALFKALESEKAKLDQEYSPDAWNIGINDGPAAGQTVPHLHIHLIPRYKDDVADPRGGIRWVLPEKAVYWKTGP